MSVPWKWNELLRFAPGYEDTLDDTRTHGGTSGPCLRPAGGAPFPVTVPADGQKGRLLAAMDQGYATTTTATGEAAPCAATPNATGCSS